MVEQLIYEHLNATDLASEYLACDSQARPDTFIAEINSLMPKLRITLNWLNTE